MQHCKLKQNPKKIKFSCQRRHTAVLHFIGPLLHCLIHIVYLNSCLWWFLLKHFDCTCRMVKNQPEMSWREIIDFCQEKQVKITYFLLLITFISWYLPSSYIHIGKLSRHQFSCLSCWSIVRSYVMTLGAQVTLKQPVCQQHVVHISLLVFFEAVEIYLLSILFCRW